MLTITRKPISELHADPANVRRHSTRNLQAIGDSIRTFGQVEPLVVQKGTGKVIGGNGRLESFRAAGVKECDVVEIEISDSQATALAIALNRTAELAEWDTDALAQTLAALQIEDEELARMTGFNDDEIKKTLETYGVFEVEGADAPELADGDRAPFQQMTFTLHDGQVETIRNAIEKAKADGHGKSDVNENSNGNALAWIAEVFCRG